MGEIQIFNFQNNDVRVINIDNEPWFVGKDICQALGYADSVNAMKQHCRGVVKRHPIVDRLGRKQEARILPESDVMRLICGSTLPEAVAFEKLVFEEILPTIRKHGAYVTEPVLDNWLNDPDRMIEALNALKAERARVRELEDRQEVDRPKVIFAESVAVAKTSILVGEMAKLIKQATGYDIGQNRFFQYLRDHGYLHGSGSQKNMPTQRSIEAGWFEIKEGTRINSDGVSVITRTPKITGKGQIYFINLFKKMAA
ncbi:phage antirepressor [uncultured Victivallis sp.]|uniref:phage antirepressor n=1 Tax=uncultured Victivallis sp. TaxID=354118 RepID=UPI00259569C2|nr:phage antirepressor [uncultured Victivallis sp.]